MVHFVGAGPGAEDLITLRGKALLEQADCVIYAGSLVNPRLLSFAGKNCEIFDSARMTLEDVLETIEAQHRKGREIVRLHTGDPSLYGAVREQMEALDRMGIPYDVTPGVSSFSGAAAALNAEYTLPGVSQSLIITRLEGRTPVPDSEGLKKLASHGSSMVIFLSVSMAGRVQEELLAGAYTPDTPCAVVYKATWPEERVIRTRLGNLARAVKEEGITKTALILVGGFLEGEFERSRLYDPSFTTGFREGSGE